MMNKNFSCSIQNLKLIPSISSKLNDNFIITSTTPFKTAKYSSLKPYILTQKKIRNKIVPFFTYKDFNIPNKRNNRYNNIYKNYKTISMKTEFNKNKKLNYIFPKISLSIDKSKYNKTNNLEKDKITFTSIYKMINAKSKCNIKKENLIFMKEKKSEIQNIHKNLMKKNELCIITKHNKELNDRMENEKNKNDEKNKFKYRSLTEENKVSFENEYNYICKNKLRAKNLIKKEINQIGRELSWIKNPKIFFEESLKNEIDEKEKIKRSIFLKKLKDKDPILEINQTSNLPTIAGDIKLMSDLWKKDMIKYCKYAINSNRPKDIKFKSDLLDIYD